jgi:hypothetical protein
MEERDCWESPKRPVSGCHADLPNGREWLGSSSNSEGGHAAGPADIAVIPGFELARQKLPFIQAIAGDGSWADSGLSASSVQLFNVAARAAVRTIRL